MATAAQGNKAMGGGLLNGPERWWNILRIVGWSMATLFLLLPLVAMQFTDEVNWGPEDFLFAAILLGGSGRLCELAIRRSSDNTYRVGVLLALASTFLLIWSNAAVGFVGSGANAANVLYFALPVIPFLGGLVSRFTARGMYLTMIITAIAQASIALFAFATDQVGADEHGAILAINAIFILFWSASAVLFQQAAVRSASPGREADGNAGPLRTSPIQFVLSALLMAIGAVMLIFMITVEGEPGMIPLVVFLLGAGWFAIALYQGRAGRRR